MNISDITNSITHSYFDYKNTRYYFDKIVSHDLSVKVKIKDKTLDNIWYDYEVIFYFKFLFVNTELVISSTKYIKKYLDEYEDKKFLFFHYKARKINPIYAYLKKNHFFLGYNYEMDLKANKIKPTESYLDYIAEKLDCVGNYLYVKTWVEKLLAVYEEYYRND